MSLFIAYVAPDKPQQQRVPRQHPRARSWPSQAALTQFLHTLHLVGQAWAIRHAMALRLAATAAVSHRPSAAPLPWAVHSRNSLHSSFPLRIQHARLLPLRHMSRRLLRTAGSTAPGAGEEGQEAEVMPPTESSSTAAPNAQPSPASSSAAASSSSSVDGGGDAANGEGLDGLMRAARLSFAAAKLEVAKSEAAKFDAKREAARAEAAQAEAELEALQASGAGSASQAPPAFFQRFFCCCPLVSSWRMCVASMQCARLPTL